MIVFIPHHHGLGYGYSWQSHLQSFRNYCRVACEWSGDLIHTPVIKFQTFILSFPRSLTPYLSLLLKLLLPTQISVDIIQQQTGKDDEFIYGLALKRVQGGSASAFCVTHDAFKEIVAEAPAIEAKIKLLHYETKRAVDEAKTRDYSSLMSVEEKNTDSSSKDRQLN